MTGCGVVARATLDQASLVVVIIHCPGLINCLDIVRGKAYEVKPLGFFFYWLINS